MSTPWGDVLPVSEQHVLVVTALLAAGTALLLQEQRGMAIVLGSQALVDGTDRLDFHGPVTFTGTGSVAVTRGARPSPGSKSSSAWTGWIQANVLPATSWPRPTRRAER
jgi:hypothetical protein